MSHAQGIGGVELRLAKDSIRKAMVALNGTIGVGGGGVRIAKSKEVRGAVGDCREHLRHALDVIELAEGMLGLLRNGESQ